MNTDHSKNELGYRTQTCGQLEHKNLIENHIKKVSIQVKCNSCKLRLAQVLIPDATFFNPKNKLQRESHDLRLYHVVHNNHAMITNHVIKW